MTASLTSLKSLYIGAEWVEPEGGAFEDVINPATEAAIGRAPVGTRADSEAAIAAARVAFDDDGWSGLHREERISYLRTMLSALADRREELRDLVVAETGLLKAAATAVGVDGALTMARGILDLAMRDPVAARSVELVGAAAGLQLGAGVIAREPVGVVAIITAYNMPFYMNLCKCFQALAVGNTVVLKTSPYTPFEALVMGVAAEAAKLPRGVLNVVTGGVEAGEVLTTDPRVDMVNFTGSDKVGAAIQAQAAPTLKRLLLELGGKSAMIVRADADLDLAAAAGLASFTSHAGQLCGLTTRHIVHESVRAAYVDKVRALAAKVRVGPPEADGVGMGPLIRDIARTRTEHYVELARDEGATLVCGGRRPADLPRGFFFEPTLFDDVRNDSRVAREEIFGPVGAVIGVESDEEAIAVANDSDYGLSGSIYSAETGRAYEMARKLRTGTVRLNGGSGGMSVHAPFGGIKRSGYGREYGIDGLNDYTYVKAIDFRAR